MFIALVITSFLPLRNWTIGVIKKKCLKQCKNVLGLVHEKREKSLLCPSPWTAVSKMLHMAESLKAQLVEARCG